MIVIWTIVATILYFIVGFFAVPFAIMILRPLIGVVNFMVSGPSAKSSELTIESHMAVGMVFFTLITVLIIYWWLAYITITNFHVNPWPIWIVAALLSIMNFSNATSRNLNVFKSEFPDV